MVPILSIVAIIIIVQALFVAFKKHRILSRTLISVAATYGVGIAVALYLSVGWEEYLVVMVVYAFFSIFTIAIPVLQYRRTSTVIA